MKKFIRDYLTFNKEQRNGILFLSAIIVLLLFSNLLIPYFIPERETDFSEFEKEIDAFSLAKKLYEDSVANIAKSDSSKRKYNYFDTTKTSKTIVNNDVHKQELFNFNPNNLPSSDWQKLGFKDWQIRTIKNYERKGGKFYSKENLKKIYGMSDELYASIEPYITIPKPTPNPSQKEGKSEASKISSPLGRSGGALKPPTLLIELNTTDSAELEKAKGIGPSFAGRIIKYKERLGGFVKKEQLLEVWGMKEKPDLYKMICEGITVNPNKIRRININTCEVKELKRHPYFTDWNAPNAIVNYRQKHGKYKVIDEIKKTGVVSDELFLILAPYLKTE